MSAEQVVESSDASAEGRRLLEAARIDARHGPVDRAWARVGAAAAHARRHADAILLARAAVALPEPTIVPWPLGAARQALCLEALAALGPQVPGESSAIGTLRRHVRAHLDLLSTGWSDRTGSATTPVDEDEAEARFAELAAAHARAASPLRVTERLELAAAAIALGRASSDHAYVAWGRFWRMGAFLELGLRLELNQEASWFGGSVAALGSPVWNWRLAAVRANLALLEDRLEDVPGLADEARARGEAAGSAEAEYFDLVLRSELARRSGAGLEELEREVRSMVAGLPVFAQTWRVGLLEAMDDDDELRAIWQMLAPHVAAMPADSPEWLLATRDLLELAARAGDRSAVSRLVTVLRPLSERSIAGPPVTPYHGPVSLVLAQAARTLRDGRAVTAWAQNAVRRSAWMGAPYFVRQAEELLGRERHRFDPLSPREAEVALLVARGRSNRQIADELFVSERTVEQHVSSALRKIVLPNRAALAAWATTAGGAR